MVRKALTCKREFDRNGSLSRIYGRHCFQRVLHNHGSCQGMAAPAGVHGQHETTDEESSKENLNIYGCCSITSGKGTLARVLPHLQREAVVANLLAASSFK